MSDDWIEIIADVMCEKHKDKIEEWDSYDGS